MLLGGVVFVWAETCDSSRRPSASGSNEDVDRWRAEMSARPDDERRDRERALLAQAKKDLEAKMLAERAAKYAAMKQRQQAAIPLRVCPSIADKDCDDAELSALAAAVASAANSATIGAAIDRARAAHAAAEHEASRTLVCCDGESSGCLCHDSSHRGCCSHHHGVCGCGP